MPAAKGPSRKNQPVHRRVISAVGSRCHDRRVTTDPSYGAYDRAEPSEHAGVCWAAAIGRASRGGRSHTDDWAVIIEDALADLTAHPERARVGGKTGATPGLAADEPFLQTGGSPA